MTLLSRLKARTGSALIMTLLIITTLTGLTIAFSEESSVNLNLAGYTRDSSRAHQIARSAVHLVMAYLDLDEDRDMDSLREDWARFEAQAFPEALPKEMSLSSRVADECGKLNLNALITEEGHIDEQRKDQLVRLFAILGLPEDIIIPLLDWLDADDIERLGGAESFYYQGLPEPYNCTNGPLLTTGQIFAVKGFAEIRRLEGSDDKRLLDFLTIYSDGKININTAPLEVLQSLSDKLDRAIAEAIVEFRAEEDFASVQDLRKLVGIDDKLIDEIKEQVTVKSSTFSIEARGECQDVAALIRAVVEREESGSKVIYWQVM